MLPIVIALIAVPAVVGLAELTRRGFSARRFRRELAAAATQPEGARFATVRVLRSGAEVNDAVARGSRPSRPQYAKRRRGRGDMSRSES